MEIGIENRDKIVALLNKGICPLCNKKYTVPLRHLNRKHGISATELKDLLLLPRSSCFMPDELREIHRNTAIEHNLQSNCIAGGLRGKADKVTRDKMRNKRLANLQKPDQLKSLEKAWKHSSEVISKEVVRVSPDGTIITYKSITEAANNNGFSPANISRRVKSGRPDLKGNMWYLLNEYRKSL